MTKIHKPKGQALHFTSEMLSLDKYFRDLEEGTETGILSIWRDQDVVEISFEDGQPKNVWVNEREVQDPDMTAVTVLKWKTIALRYEFQRTVPILGERTINSTVMELRLKAAFENDSAGI